MQFKVTEWHGDALLAKPAAILEAYGPVIAEELKQQIATVQFPWEWSTLRFTSLYMKGEPEASGRFSPPTTAAGARNTLSFKRDTQARKYVGSGVHIKPGKRDAVDTGALQASQSAPQVMQLEAGAQLQIVWNAPYSGLVLRGGDYGSYTNVKGQLVKVGTRPKRDWITPALAAQPFAPFFKQMWKQGQA